MKRATQVNLTEWRISSNFNPRPHEEGDKKQWLQRGFYGYFNPRPREEGDGTAAYSYFVLGYFNPRPREEGDEVIMDYNKMINIFQSTPS